MNHINNIIQLFNSTTPAKDYHYQHHANLVGDNIVNTVSIVNLKGEGFTAENVSYKKCLETIATKAYTANIIDYKDYSIFYSELYGIN